MEFYIPVQAFLQPLQGLGADLQVFYQVAEESKAESMAEPSYEKAGIEKEADMEEDKSTNDDESEEESPLPSKKQIGLYTKEERSKRIQKYKKKQRVWRESHPLKKKYPGRSLAAKTKIRSKGRFIKTSDVSDDFSYVITPNA